MLIVLCNNLITTNAADSIICDNGITVTCSYKLNHYIYGRNEEFDNSFLSCVGKKDLCYDVNNSTLILEYMCPPHTNSLVESFELSSEKLRRIPENLERYFPNIHALVLNNNIIKTISNDELIPHAQLELIELSHNEITNLETDVFDGLMYLKVVVFHHNNIKYIGHDIRFPAVFVDLKSNFCTKDMSIFDSDLYYYILVHCPPLISQISNALRIRENWNNGNKKERMRFSMLDQDYDVCSFRPTTTSSNII